MRLRTAILALIPGAAHVDLGRAGRGLAAFALFALLADASVMAPFLGASPAWRAGLGAAAAAVWALAWVDAIRLGRRLRGGPPAGG